MPYPEGHRLESFSAVVSSLRADCVVAACTGWSREKTKAGITAGLVTVNYTPCLSPSVLLSAGDRIAIRGKGKFCIGAIGGKTRKGRIGMEVKKYL
jgi:RNA-binding protein YlmH